MIVPVWIRGFFGRSGGWGYHLAALVYSRSLWAPFRRKVSEALSRRIPDAESVDLVIIGSSGGYCLDQNFLSRFKSVTAVDIDPASGWIFRKRFSDLKDFRFLHQDFFSEIMNSNPFSKDTVFLFSNVLGQLGYLYSGEKLNEVNLRLDQWLSGVRWLSLHDRVSIPGKASVSFYSGERLSVEELVRKFADRVDGLIVEEHELGEWVNRATGEFTYFAWPITRARMQVIEVCGG